MKHLKKYGIWIALLVVAIACVWVAGLDDEPATSNSKAKIARTPVSAKKAKAQAGALRDPTAALATIDKGFAPRSAMTKLRRDPFAVVSFEPPPPPAPPPPAPKAPPLRFKYLGALQGGDEQERAVFLDHAGQMLIARKGDTLAGQYRVLEINEINMQLEYTPLAERQTLRFGR